MRILITGGNGYVGRTLTRRLYREHQVSVLDNLRHGRLRFCARRKAASPCSASTSATSRPSSACWPRRSPRC